LDVLQETARIKVGQEARSEQLSGGVIPEETITVGSSPVITRQRQVLDDPCLRGTMRPLATELR
jgi:hypothetical protein